VRGQPRRRGDPQRRRRKKVYTATLKTMRLAMGPVATKVTALEAVMLKLAPMVKTTALQTQRNPRMNEMHP
jgi:hypothetical protein